MATELAARQMLIPGTPGEQNVSLGQSPPWQMEAGPEASFLGRLVNAYWQYRKGMDTVNVPFGVDVEKESPSGLLRLLSEQMLPPMDVGTLNPIVKTIASAVTKPVGRIKSAKPILEAEQMFPMTGRKSPGDIPLTKTVSEEMPGGGSPFAGSKLPNVAYHGTDVAFEKLDPSKRGGKTRAASATKGFFFTNNPRTAEYYTEATKFPDQATERAYEDFVRGRIEDIKKEDHVTLKSNGLEYEMLFAHEPKNLPTFRRNVLEAFRTRDPDVYNELIEANYLETGNGLLSAAKQYYSKRVLSLGFKPGTQTEIAVAEYMLKERARALAVREGNQNFGVHGEVKAAYLDIKNPLVYTFRGGKAAGTINKIIDKAQSLGHDGVIFKNVNDAGAVSDQYVVFSPDQVKFLSNPTRPLGEVSGK